jgi:cytochrome c553
MKTIIAILALSIAGFTAQADDASIKDSCVKCHSATTTSFPRIDGQSEEYIFQTLKDYTSKVRHSPMAVAMMTSKVKALNDNTLKYLATYFSQLPVSPAIAGDAALIEKGQYIYNNVMPGTTLSCVACHGIDGIGKGNNDPLNPRLAGQTKNFLKVQFANYKSGAIDNQAVMHDISVALTDEQVAALVEFLASRP